MLLDPNQVADNGVEHMLDLLRYSESIREDVFATLDQLIANLRHLVADSGLRAGGYTSQTYRRQESLIRQASKSIQSVYREMADAVGSSLEDLAPGEAEWALQTLTDASGGAMASDALSASKIDVALSQANVGGATADEWFSKLALDLKTRFAQLVRSSTMMRQGTEQILVELGKPAGLRTVAQNALTGLIRSAVPAAANSIQYAVYENNEVEGIQWFSLLDPRTCIQCAALDGAVWKLSGEPLSLSATKQPFPGPPPLHWSCRCTVAPLISASAIASTLTYQDWLKAKPLDYVKTILGQSRAKLFADGKLTLAEMVNPTGRKLTLKELYRKVKVTT